MNKKKYKKKFSIDLKKNVILLCCILYVGIIPVIAQRQQKQSANIALSERMEKFGQLKFGMFIHWGPYAELAGSYEGQKIGGNAEWIMSSAKISSSKYEKICKNWDPSGFDAEAWVELAKEAGMKYLVFTTKHHDGFCMFRSKFTDYNIVDYTPFKRDVTKELSLACNKSGIKLGLYYSLADWHHYQFPAQYSNLGSNFHGNPNSDADVSKYADYQLAQMGELLSNYGNVSMVWFDGGGSFQNADRYNLLKGDSIISLIRELQPECLINDRIGGGKGDYGTPEQLIPGEIQQQGFESCMTMNDTWGFSNYDHNWKTTEELLLKLVDIVHKGGNFLLNIGPDGKGNIPEESIQCLKEIGSWLNVYGESVYGTYNSLFEAFPWGKSSTKFYPDGNSAIYLFIENWEVAKNIKLKGIRNSIKAVELLSPTGQINLENSMKKKVLSIKLPVVAPNKLINVVRICLQGTPDIKE